MLLKSLLQVHARTPSKRIHDTKGFLLPELRTPQRRALRCPTLSLRITITVGIPGTEFCQGLREQPVSGASDPALAVPGRGRERCGARCGPCPRREQRRSRCCLFPTALTAGAAQRLAGGGTAPGQALEPLALPSEGATAGGCADGELLPSPRGVRR